MLISYSNQRLKAKIAMSWYRIQHLVGGGTFANRIYFPSYEYFFCVAEELNALQFNFLRRYGCRATSVLGSLLSSVAMSVSVFAPNLSVLIFTHGVVGGVGIGLTYLPSMIACNYYFVKRRALAVSIGVCGQGMFTFVLSQ